MPVVVNDNDIPPTPRIFLFYINPTPANPRTLAIAAWCPNTWKISDNYTIWNTEYETTQGQEENIAYQHTDYRYKPGRDSQISRATILTWRCLIRLYALAATVEDLHPG